MSFLDIFSAEGGGDLPSDKELQCSDNYCCSINQKLGVKCSLSSLPDNRTSMIFPGGNTRCLKSYSTPYAFQVHKGAKDKLLFYFQGGGSCWNEKGTNSSGRGKTGGTYCRTDAVPWPIYGVFDQFDQRNTFADYTIVNVLYCSGDNHAGNAVRSYNDDAGNPIEQRGAVNTEAVITWVQGQQLAGELASTFQEFVVMGCSAGALATQIWGNELVRRFNYPQHTALVIDSYLGIFPGNVEGEIIYNLGMCSLSFLSSSFQSLCMEKNASADLFVTTALASQPRLPYLYIQSRYDRVQVKYYNFIADEYGYNEIDSDTFEAMSDAVIQEYNKFPNFLAYLVDSNQHCYTPTPYMFYADTEGLDGYSNDDDNDDMSGGDDDNDDDLFLDLEEETMNRWLSRAPLRAGETISSQCASDSCTTYGIIPKSFVQSSLDGNVKDGIYYGSSENEPSRRVQQMHMLPHFDENLNVIESGFNISSISQHDNPWKHYATSIMPLPILIYLFGIFVVLVFQFYLVFRRALGYNPYAKFDDDEDCTDDDVILFNKKRGPTPPVGKMFLFKGSLALAFLANILIFVGNAQLDNGTATANRALTKIDESFLSVDTITDSFMANGANVSSTLNEMSAQGCDDAAQVAEYSTEFESLAMSLKESIDPAEPYIRKSEHIMNYWVETRKNQFIWVTFCLNTACICFFYIAFRSKSAIGMQLSLLFTEVIVILNMVFGILYMMSLMGASDFCMQPTDYVLAMAPEGSTRDTLNYYATCQGESPTAGYTRDAEYSLNMMSYFVDYLGQSKCPDQSDMAAQAQSNLQSVDEGFESINNIAACESYVPYWEDVFYNGVCSEAFDGMYLIWITQTVTAICLLGATMLSSSIYPYFQELQKLGFESEMYSSHGSESEISNDDAISSLSSGTARHHPVPEYSLELGSYHK